MHLYCKAFYTNLTVNVFSEEHIFLVYRNSTLLVLHLIPLGRVEVWFDFGCPNIEGSVSVSNMAKSGYFGHQVISDSDFVYFIFYLLE